MLKVINESTDFERYTYVKSKMVNDSDGFNTEYTMYYDEVEDRYVFVFGDSDLYDPNDDDYEEFDYECDTEREANEWFDNYKGFEDEFESKKIVNESKRILDLPKDIAEFVFSRQPDADGDDYQFENAIEACEKLTELSDEAYEDQNILEQELSDVDEKRLKMLAAELGVYEMVDDNDLAYMADTLKSSDDLITVMQMNGFKDVERKGNKIYYSRGRNGKKEFIDAPEWR